MPRAVTPPPEQSTQSAGLEPGSFRDPESRVFYAGDGVYRALSADGLADFEALRRTGLLEDPRIVATERVQDGGVDRSLLVHEPAAVLKHERIPFVSYPYEWTFSMLKDAALLQLDLLLAALERDLVLKDSTPYNVQFRGAQALFVDIGSFERLRPGEPWAGYRQFCMLYLYPLMLQAYRDLPFHAALRGSVDGIAPHDARAILGTGGGRLRKGVLANVVLHARMEDRYADAEGRDVKRELRGAGMDARVLDAMLGKLQRLVEGLEWHPGETAWTGYGADNSYDEASAARKAELVAAAAARRPGGVTWDVGCNDGTYTRIAAEHADLVLALDADHATVDALYRRLREERRTDILALVMNVTDPSPDLGWRGLERASLERRGTPELTLCLAVVHHVCITGNVPVPEFLEWLRSLDTSLVIEFPDRSDPMVQRLLSGKRDGSNPDYEAAAF